MAKAIELNQILGTRHLVLATAPNGTRGLEGWKKLCAQLSTADVTLRYSAGSFSPFMKVENATNKHYEEVFGYPSATRRLIAGIRYSLR